MNNCKQYLNYVKCIKRGEAKKTMEIPLLISKSLSIADKEKFL